MLRILTTLLLVAIIHAPALATDYAPRPVLLEATDELSAELRKGENFSVDAKIRNDGLINFYMLDTDYGRLSVEGTAELKERGSELNALVLMEKMERSKVFKDALVGGVKATGEGVVELVTSPIDTTKEIIEGTGQFLSNIGEAFVSDDPNQDNALKVALGYDTAKRQFAFEFGINPYSDYEPVIDRLGEIARAAVAGGLTPKAALAAIDHDLATIAQISGTARGMQKLVRDNPPNKLREINLEKLKKMGIAENLAEAFLDNYSYNPQEKTLLVGELATMDGVAGRDLFLARADLATEKSTARYYRSMAQLIGRYHRNVREIKAILDTGGVINLRDAEDRRVVLAPVDHVFWTERLDRKEQAFRAAAGGDAGQARLELWLSGAIDPAARAQLETRGWTVTDRADRLLLKRQPPPS